MNIRQIGFESALGELYLSASERGLRSITWSPLPLPLTQLDDSDDGIARILRQGTQELEEYLAGLRQNFSLALDLEGTSFQQQVWAQLRMIPFGQTISYQQLAGAVGQPRAARAVGSANGKNPLSIVIPCHRVIATGGGLGGYAGGLEQKRLLLALERRVQGGVP